MEKSVNTSRGVASKAPLSKRRIAMKRPLPDCVLPFRIARVAAPWGLLGVLVAGFVVGLLALPTPDARAGAQGFLCPSSGRLISVGQVAEDVRRKCREPDDIQRRVEVRTVRETRRRWVNGYAEDVTVERTIDVPIEEWFFDFGSTRFTKLLRFESGRLVFVEEGAKGTPGGG